ncbi:MAG: hypothetical protein RLZZ621_1979 [Gemmatimonadota bacterium]|jgi:predicted deacetylase
MRATRSGALLVSIHDVTPAWDRETRLLWQLCRNVGITPALCVVPAWHGRWPLTRHASYVRWVQECERQGAELFLHGERHDEDGLRRSWRDGIRALGQTAREGEFLTLNRDEALLRIARGLGQLRALDLSPIGFVPPAWLARECTHDVVREVGLRFSEDVRSIRLHDLRTGATTRRRAQAVRWSSRTAMRAHLSHAVSLWHLQRQRANPLVRLALHPQDLSHPVTALSVRVALRRWSQVRTTMRYQDLQ